MAWPPWPVMQPSGVRPLPVPPPLPGKGMMSELRRTVASLDVVHTFDRTLGKTQSIPLKGKMAQFSKIQGTLSAGEALGRLAGPLYA